MRVFRTYCKEGLQFLLHMGNMQVGTSSSDGTRPGKDAARGSEYLPHEQKRAKSISCFLWYTWHFLHLSMLASIPLVENQWWALFVQGQKLPFFLALAAVVCCVVLHRSLFESDPGTTAPGIVSSLDLPTRSSDSCDLNNIERSNRLGSTSDREYCQKCCLPRLLRSKHCRICGTCVKKYDHHCVWLGTCIGERNQRNFCIFLFMETTLLIAFIEALLQGFSPVYRASSMSGWIRYNVLGMFGIAVPLLFLCLLIPHFIMQMVFATTNQTSWEFFNGSSLPYLADVPDNVHPFSKGPLVNLYLFCLQKHPEQYQLPSKQELFELSSMETIWENKHYSCF